MTIRHIDLCSGIGGFALAAHWAGYQTEVFCERDEFCRKVLAKHWPRVPVVDDIHDFDGRPYAGADLLTGGIPCQPYSCAGKQLGDDDDRALWPKMLRVITEARPRWIVIENVAGFINMALDGVLVDLEEEGYDCGTVVLPACAVNAPHRRDRVWVVANSNVGSRQQGQSQSSQRSLSGFYEKGDSVVADAINGGRIGRSPKPGREPETRIAAGGNGESVADSAKQGLQDRRRPSLERRDSLAEFERCDCGSGSIGQPESRLGRVADGLPARMDGHFDAEPDIPRVAKGIPNRAARLKALGNAIVPQVAYRLFQAMEMADRCITESLHG